MTYEDNGYDQFLRKLPMPQRVLYSGLTFDSVVEDEGIATSTLNSTFYGGNIKIYDQYGNNVVDKYGLNSESQFQFGTVIGVGTQTTGNTSYEDVVGMTLSFKLLRVANVLFCWQTVASVQGYQEDDATRYCYMILTHNGDGEANMLGERAELVGSVHGNLGDPAPHLVGEPASYHYLSSFSAGEHVLKLQMRTTNAVYDAICYRDDTRITYVVLGS
jgi:hypothetical protein